MGIINWVSHGGLIIDVIIVLIIALNATWGYRRGLIDVVFKIFAFIIGIIVAFVLYKQVTNAIIDHTGLDEWLTGKIVQKLQGTSLEEGELIEYNENSTVSEGAVNVLNSLVSEAVKKSKDNVIVYVANNLAIYIIRFGVIILLFIATRVVLLFFSFLAETIALLPLIRTLNKSGGLVYGVIKGFLIVYVVLAIFSILSPLIVNWGVLDSVQGSSLGNKMYNNNIILELIFK